MGAWQVKSYLNVISLRIFPILKCKLEAGNVNFRPEKNLPFRIVPKLLLLCHGVTNLALRKVMAYGNKLCFALNTVAEILSTIGINPPEKQMLC